jgi:hypothetical protein
MQFSGGQDDMLSCFLNKVFGTRVSLIEELQAADEFGHVTCKISSSATISTGIVILTRVFGLQGDSNNRCRLVSSA